MSQFRQDLGAGARAIVAVWLTLSMLAAPGSGTILYAAAPGSPAPGVTPGPYPTVSPAQATQQALRPASSAMSAANVVDGSPTSSAGLQQ